MTDDMGVFVCVWVCFDWECIFLCYVSCLNFFLHIPYVGLVTKNNIGTDWEVKKWSYERSTTEYDAYKLSTALNMYSDILRNKFVQVCTNIETKLCNSSTFHEDVDV